MRTRRVHRHSGFTALEMAMSAIVAAAVLGASVTLTMTMQRGAASSTRSNALANRAAQLTERLVHELTVASLRGEDVNGNGVLDSGEDTNFNGRLDADWSVADGTTASDDFSYNVREHGTWTFSDRIRWKVNAGSSLMRVDGQGATQMARGVQLFEVTRDGSEVTVRVVLRGTDGNGETQREGSQRRVYVRN